MMNSLMHLWLPILLSAVAVSFWTILSCALLSLHKGDNRPVPDEEGFLKAVRPLNLPPGNYAFPYCGSHKQRNDPTFVEKWKAGPVGTVGVWNPNPNMGLMMLFSFMVYLVVSILAAYVAVAAGLPHGAGFARIFQVMGAVGILSYSFAALPAMIWYQANCSAKYMALLDGVISGLATGAIFAALWPS